MPATRAGGTMDKTIRTALLTTIALALTQGAASRAWAQ